MFVQTMFLCRYGCMYLLAELVLVCEHVIVMSSAYFMIRIGALGAGKYAVEMLNSMGVKTPP